MWIWWMCYKGVGGRTLLKKRCLKGRKFRNLRRGVETPTAPHNHRSLVFCAVWVQCRSATDHFKDFLYFPKKMSILINLISMSMYFLKWLLGCTWAIFKSKRAWFEVTSRPEKKSRWRRKGGRGGETKSSFARMHSEHCSDDGFR